MKSGRAKNTSCFQKIFSMLYIIMSWFKRHVTFSGVPGYVVSTAQPQQPVPPPFTEQDVLQIKEMFPDAEVEVVRSLMETNGGNKDATINNLLAMQT